MVIRVIQLLVALLLFVGDLYFAQAQSINIVDENGELIVRTDALLTGGTTYLSIEALRLVFDADLRQSGVTCLDRCLCRTFHQSNIRCAVGVSD